MDTKKPSLVEATRQIEFVGIETQSVIYSNVFLLQRMVDGYVLTVGQGAPLIYGTPEEQKQQVDAMDKITVTPIVRLALTQAVAENLLAQLQELLGASVGVSEEAEK